MSVRGLVLLFAIGTLLIAGCNSDGGSVNVTARGEGVTRQIGGNWTGKLHQQGLARFDVAVDIATDGTGRVAYSGIACAGRWSLDSVQPSTPPRYLFTETIKEGAGGSCKGTGRVTLAPIQGHAPNEPAYNRLNYSFAGGGVASRGLLHRTDPEHLAPIFKQAGVTPP